MAERLVEVGKAERLVEVGKEEGPKGYARAVVGLPAEVHDSSDGPEWALSPVRERTGSSAVAPDQAV